MSKYPNPTSPAKTVADKLVKVLSDFSIDPKKALLVSSVCRDEICDEAVKPFEEYFGSPFSMTALGGFPIGGRTAMGAASHHVADGGCMVILGNAHIGVNESGELGKILRKGMSHESTSCGAMCALLARVKDGNGRYKPAFADFTLNQAEVNLDCDQTILELAMLPHMNPDSTLVDATMKLSAVITSQFEKLLEGQKYPFHVVYVGGVNINTPVGQADLIDVQTAFVIKPDGEKVVVTEKLA